MQLLSDYKVTRDFFNGFECTFNFARAQSPIAEIIVQLMRAPGKFFIMSTEFDKNISD